MAMPVGEAEVAASVAAGELPVIEGEQVRNGGGQVVDAGFGLGDGQPHE